MAELNTPKTPIFQAPDRPLNVTATGIEQLGRAAARVGEQGAMIQRLDTQAGQALDRGLTGLGGAVNKVGGALEQHEAQTDVTALNDAHVGLITGLQSAHDAWFSDPANHPLAPDASQRFRDDVVSPATDQLRDMAQTPLGRTHAENLANSLDTHFAEMANQTAAKNAGIAVARSLSNQTSALTDAVTQNPANLPLALNTFDQSMAAYQQANPNLTSDAVAADRQQFRQNMITTAGKALVDQQVQNGQTPNPSAFTSRYGEDIGPEHVQALNDYADHMVRAKAFDTAATQSAQKQQFAQNSATTASSIFDNLGDMDANKPFNQDFAAKIIARPDMAGEDKGAVIGAYRRITGDEPPADTSSTTMDGLLSGLASTANRPTPAAIMGQYAKGDLSYEDASWAIKAASAPPSAGLQQLNQNLTTARASLMTDPGSGAFNPAGAAAYQRFQSFAVSAFRQDEPIDPKQLPTLLQTFQPTGRDAVAQLPIPANRPSLASIFGGK